MRSRSSSSAPADLLPVGRIRGHRGRAGELTIDTLAEDARLWVSARRLWIRASGEGQGEFRQVERCRAYRNRLVVKLVGIEDADAAARLGKAQVAVSANDVDELPQGVYFADLLVGLEVVDGAGRVLGRVDGVLATGGTDVLRVVPDVDRDRTDETEDEILIPLAKEIVREVDRDRGRIVVELPEGLETLNRSDAEPAEGGS